jgi:hypothetical protein
MVIGRKLRVLVVDDEHGTGWIGEGEIGTNILLGISPANGFAVAFVGGAEGKAKYIVEIFYINNLGCAVEGEVGCLGGKGAVGQSELAG